MVSTLQSRLAEVHARIAAACARAGRDPASVTLVAVSKSASPDQVAAAALAGQRHFGVNRVPDGMRQIQALRAGLGMPLPLTWHFIGHLQTNKARDAVSHFDSIDSVDSLRLAQKLSAEALRAGITLPILLELNLLPGSDRTGFAEAELVAAAPTIAALPGLAVRGLLAIAPHTPDERELRAAFGRVVAVQRHLRAGVATAAPPRGPRPDVNPAHPMGTHPDGAASPSWSTLSMGMSGDYEIAIECGATEVRLGRTLFEA